MSKFYEVRWHGRGGQGTVTGAKSLGEAVQGGGKFVVAFPEYGPERRGAPLRAFNRFSDHEIRIHTPVQNPDVVIVVDPTLIGSGAIIAGVKPETQYIVNTRRPAGEIKALLKADTQKVFTIPANRISRELFKKEIPNSAMMGAFAKAAGHIISIDQLVEEAEHVFAKMLGPELVEKNLEAMRLGYESGDVI
ncbi:MAG: pyruvate synthase [Desulfobacteraceae bacterium]|nr:2-oxoacid:acceptor oxidoreductase family protein [Desulfobacteraceae bacterium]MBC2755526.1 pyruvate synthase [Desulfobacteraceae bacterium]